MTIAYSPNRRKAKTLFSEYAGVGGWLLCGGFRHPQRRPRSLLRFNLYSPEWRPKRGYICLPRRPRAGTSGAWHKVESLHGNRSFFILKEYDNNMVHTHIHINIKVNSSEQFRFDFENPGRVPIVSYNASKLVLRQSRGHMYSKLKLSRWNLISKMLVQSALIECRLGWNWGPASTNYVKTASWDGSVISRYWLSDVPKITIL